LAALYEPLQTREHLGESVESVEKLGFLTHGADGARVAKIVSAIEAGRRVTRDVGGADCERMTPRRCAQYIEDTFKGTDVKVIVNTDDNKLKDEYPLLHSVARASLVVTRHLPCVVRLEYTGPGDTDETLLCAGKGVTYDTGGADIKHGGVMAGMSRDKLGAAAYAGFLKTVSLLKPKGLKVIAELGFVRNSVGANGYVSDEILLSHAKKRVLIGNTDAEGRLVLADLLSHLRLDALTAINPKVMTAATLTGHAGRSVGSYTISLDNGPAKLQDLSRKLQASGELWGDCIEVSTIRKDDFSFIAPKNSTYDVSQCNTEPSTATQRGHQFPAAFLITASGLIDHGKNSSHPIPFCHIDIAGSACIGGYHTGTPTATPITALTARYVIDRV